MRITNQTGLQQPAGLNVNTINQPGAGTASDFINGAGTYTGWWGAITALVAAVVTVVTTSIKTQNGVPSTVLATNFVAGGTYTIQSLGTTNWLAIGAPVAAVGVTFTATGAGAGTGTALQGDEQTVAGLIIPAGTTIYGEFKSITWTSGTVLAYRG